MLFIKLAEEMFLYEREYLHRNAMKALRGLKLLLSAVACLTLARAALLSSRTGLPVEGVMRPFWFSSGVLAGVVTLVVGMGAA
jgi:hypothetical protein